MKEGCGRWRREAGDMMEQEGEAEGEKGRRVGRWGGEAVLWGRGFTGGGDGSDSR